MPLGGAERPARGCATVRADPLAANAPHDGAEHQSLRPAAFGAAWSPLRARLLHRAAVRPGCGAAILINATKSAGLMWLGSVVIESSVPPVPPLHQQPHGCRASQPSNSSRLGQTRCLAMRWPSRTATRTGCGRATTTASGRCAARCSRAMLRCPTRTRWSSSASTSSSSRRRSSTSGRRQPAPSHHPAPVAAHCPPLAAVARPETTTWTDGTRGSLSLLCASARRRYHRPWAHERRLFVPSNQHHAGINDRFACESRSRTVAAVGGASCVSGSARLSPQPRARPAALTHAVSHAEGAARPCGFRRAGVAIRSSITPMVEAARGRGRQHDEIQPRGHPEAAAAPRTRSVGGTT